MKPVGWSAARAEAALDLPEQPGFEALMAAALEAQ